MAKPKLKTREIIIKESKGFFKKQGTSKKDYDFEGINALRRLLTNEKARVLNVIKTKQPGSIYELAKILGRNFKSVSEDIKLLKRFGFIELYKVKDKKRIKYKPQLSVDGINIQIRV